jgi:hypothetical protein
LRALGLLGFLGTLSIPTPDRPIVWATIFLAFEIEARNRLKDLQPRGGVAPDLDLRFNWSKRVECLIEQIAHDAGLWLIARRANVTDRQVVVHAHVAFDEPGDVPMLGCAVVALEDEDVAARRGAGIALTPPLVVGVGEGRTDRVTQRRGVRCFGRTDAISQTSFFHSASCRTA